MSYTGNTPILGRGRVSAAAIQAFFEARGKAAAPRYAPDGEYQAPPADVGVSIVEICVRHGGNHDLVTAQMGKESAWWQSAICRDKNNPSGHGATNDAPYQNAITYPSPRAGIKASISHLLSYVLGDENPIKDVNPRHEVLRGIRNEKAHPEHGYLGIASVWRDLNGRWALPGDGYGESVARIANELVAFAKARNQIIEEESMRDPQATWKPSSNYTKGRGGHAVRWIILHTTEGSYAGSLNWLRGAAGNTSNRNSSSHYILDANGGRLAQLVDERDTAWTAGNWGYNQQSVNIEMEGYAGRGGFTDGLYQAVGALVARIAERHGLDINRDVVIGHGDVPNQDHWDPGPHFDFERVLGIARESTEPNDPCRYFDVTGHYLCHGFRGYWEDNGGVAIFGYPLSEEFDRDGMTVQWFERARFEYQPTIAGNKHGVVLGRVGAESRKQDEQDYPEAFAPQDPPERTA